MTQGTQMQDQIAAPMAKAASALAAGATTSVMSFAAQNHHFFPQDYSGWAAAIASTVAATYSLCLLGEWLWKRLWRASRKVRPA